MPFILLLHLLIWVGAWFMVSKIPVERYFNNDNAVSKFAIAIIKVLIWFILINLVYKLTS